MKRFFAYLWRHPRRTGFILFNVLVVLALFGWAELTKGMAVTGLSGLPNLMLGYTGMGFLLAAWIVAWFAWAIMVFRRHARLNPPPAQTP